MDELTIKVWASENEPGYFYDIFDTVDVTDETESVDGGFCTTTMGNALEMAYVQAGGKVAKENAAEDVEIYVNQILELFDDRDEITQSDLQGVVEALVMGMLRSK